MGGTARALARPRGAAAALPARRRPRSLCLPAAAAPPPLPPRQLSGLGFFPPPYGLFSVLGSALLLLFLLLLRFPRGVAGRFFGIRGAGAVMQREENGIVSGSGFFITLLQNKARCLQISKQAEGCF